MRFFVILTALSFIFSTFAIASEESEKLLGHSIAGTETLTQMHLKMSETAAAHENVFDRLAVMHKIAVEALEIAVSNYEGLMKGIVNSNDKDVYDLHGEARALEAHIQSAFEQMHLFGLQARMGSNELCPTALTVMSDDEVHAYNRKLADLDLRFNSVTRSLFRIVK